MVDVKGITSHSVNSKYGFNRSSTYFSTTSYIEYFTYSDTLVTGHYINNLQVFNYVTNT